jgi:hypothetical protein
VVLAGITFVAFVGHWSISLSIFLSIILISVPLIYFMVSWSLFNQCLIIENRRAIATFRRSYELVKGRWWQFFGVYLVASWVTSAVTSVLFGLVLLTFSGIVPELAPVRDMLLSAKFLSLFVGGDFSVELAHAPGVWTFIAVVVLRNLVSALLMPIWAILTTYLYLEQAG